MEALLKFKEGLKDHSGWLSSWVGDDCCNWLGIGCNNQTSNVEMLDLRTLDFCDFIEENDAAAKNKSCLSGMLNPSLLNLTYLNYLDVSCNNFEGSPIPEFIGSLKNLRYLIFHKHPSLKWFPLLLGIFQTCSTLMSLHNHIQKRLWVSDLNLLSGLSSVQYLRLGGMNLSLAKTHWLQNVNMLPSLLQLDLSSSELQNFALSRSFINLTSLSNIDLSYNNFISPVPQWLFNISTLEKVQLSCSEFSGSIPQIPQGNLCNLHSLDISYNHITDEIKELTNALSACNASTLETLDLASNKLSDNLPDSLGNLLYLEYLGLSENSFLGSLPTSIGNLSHLRATYLSFNMISGIIPENIGQLSELYMLDLYGNSWEGVITEYHFQNLIGLDYLTISSSNNSLVLNVRHNWIAPFYLYTAVISDCQLGPAFPSWIRTQVHLSEITQSKCAISDTIPDWLWGLLSHI